MNAKSKQYLSEDTTLKFLDRRLWVRLGVLMKGHKLTVSAAFLCLMAGEFLPQYLPRILKTIVDGPVATGRMEELLPLCLMLFGLVVAAGIFRYFSVILSQAAALRIVHRLRLDLFKTVESFKLDFFKRTTVGRLMTRLTSDIDSISTMFSDGFIDLAGAVLMLFFPIGFMFQLNWKLSALSLSMVPLMLIATSIFRVKVRESNGKIRRTIAALNTHVQETLSGNYIVRIFGKSREQFTRLDGINAELKDHWLRNVLYYAYYFPVIGGLTELSLSILYFAGAWYFFRGEVTIGTLLAFTWYMQKFWRPMREISDRYTQLQSALAASERVFTLFDTDAVMPAGRDPVLPEGAGIEFDHVSFGYDQGETVLSDIDFSLESGRVLAVVGATGSGKSTLLSLCCGFYQPDSGRILVNGKELNTYSPGIIQQVISYVPQDVYLYAQTVAFNIALSDDYDMDRIREICRYVNAAGFIEKMEHGYETRLRERGENLSTGQRQLLAFARALYHRPRFLLLDEATSAVDTETESLIQDALAKITRDVTSIVVAHRLSTIQAADSILVIHKGRIVEVGTHDQLIGLNGIYHKLWEMQSFDLNGK